MAEKKDIKYVNKEFRDFRNNLVEYAKNYFPETYNDFSPDSPGMMFIEMAAYVGDVLGFYQDKQFQEVFTQYAQNPKNLYSIAYMMGYKPKITTAAQVEITVSQILPANNGNPDLTYAAVIEEGTVIRSSSVNNIPFILRDRVDFSEENSLQNTEVFIEEIENGNPVEFRIEKTVPATSGTIETTTRTFGSAEKFTTITLEDTDIIEVISIRDSNNNEWKEVPYLGQNTVFVENTNTSNDSNKVPYSLKVEQVDRRFTTRVKSTQNLEIQFGSGIINTQDSTFIPNPEDIENTRIGGMSSLFNTYDPSNFLSSRSYGLAPSNTVLTIEYLKGGGVQANVPANTITQIEGRIEPKIPGQIDYLDTVEVTNKQPATGGGGAEPLQELRENIRKTFAEQGRVVSLQDMTIRALSLPARYGTVSKVYVGADKVRAQQVEDPLATVIYILSKNNIGQLETATETLKNNLKEYLPQFTGILDKVYIKDAYIVNIGIDYEIITLPGQNSREVLANVTEKLQELFEVEKWSINQPINLSKIATEIDKVNGVQTVQKVQVTNKVGGDYSEYAYEIEGAIKNNIVYPSIDPMIFEVKFPEKDITGKTVTT